MNKKKKLLVLSLCLVLVSCYYGATGRAESEPTVGQSVGNFKFPQPMSDEDAKYLGLAKAGEFTLQDIKSPYVLVEQFNTSCPHCMAQAPVMNSLFNSVQQDPALKDKLKFLAMGQGNDDNAVKMWKAFHKVPFALFPDPQSTFGKALNFSPYPVTVVLDKTGKILFVHIGAFDNADEVLKKIKAVVR
jgi:thiol-disulfide isomerase/thioredoxin